MIEKYSTTQSLLPGKDVADAVVLQLLPVKYMLPPFEKTVEM